MKKVKRRTMSLLCLVLLIAVGLSFYIFKYITQGEMWASFASNQTVYSQGQLMVGKLYDRNGIVLASVNENERVYAEDSDIRKATFHAVGDAYGNIGTGALTAFSPELIGYDPVNGSYSIGNTGGELYLSIDAELNSTALKALDGRKGVVAVSNYETGEIICMVSSPTYDPCDPPDDVSGEEYEGVYINRFLSSAYTPGSTFKLVTATAAIENISRLTKRTFTCEGSVTIGDDVITCSGVHGEINFEEALAVSCNCAFGELAAELGSEKLKEYAEQLGLTGSLSIDGIATASGAYEISESINEVAWSGIGQYKDMINPAAMLRFMGAIANRGVAVDLTLKKDGSSGEERLIKKSTADKLAEMMNYNVYYTYGTDNYPGLELYAKSGTAEVGGDKKPHALFAGFIKNEDHPYAFIVIVENGGGGSSVAGAVANTVLQAAVDK